jgi:hypothetical protein
MQNSGFSAPILVRSEGACEVLKQVPLNQRRGCSYDEKWLQDLLFRHPQALPISEIDDSFAGLIPLCVELDTPAGPIDAVYITPGGRLALLETKLYRNPEARRAVVGQILDYAKELAHWDYSLLDSKVRQARKNTSESFPGVAEYVAQTHPELVLHRFQDAVTKSLTKGDFLLLVAGDGIREGVGAIAQYLDRSGSLRFTFGLIECAIYENPGGGHYVHPRVLAQTTLLTRTVLVQSDGRIAEQENEEGDGTGSEEIRPDLMLSRERYQKFWSEFLGIVHVEASQPLPSPAKSTNQNFAMPKGSDCRVAVYLGQSTQQAGVYLAFTRGSAVASRIYEALLRDRDEIERALGVRPKWHTNEKGGQNWIIIQKSFAGVFLEGPRAEIQRWLADQTERFIVLFRPRIERLLREQE